MNATATDRLVSTAVLAQRRQEEREELERLRPLLSQQVVAYAERVLTAWERAEVDAQREYVSTAKASALTHWSEDTLRRYGKLVLTSGNVPPEWAGLLARFDGDWAFVLSTIPVKGARAA